MSDELLNRLNRRLEINEQLSKVMNKIHDVNYSSRFWLILLRDYIKIVSNDEALLSRSIVDDKPLFLPINPWNHSKERAFYYRLRYHVLKTIKFNAFSKLKRELKKNDNIFFGARSYEISRYNSGQECPEHYPIVIGRAENNKRKTAKNIANEIDDIFLSNVVRNIPKYYVEYFFYLYNIIPEYRVDNKIFHGEHISSPFTYFIIAKYVEKGAKFYQYQGGGFVGEKYDVTYNPVRYKLCDKYFTYGWSINEKTIPNQAFRLDSFKEKYVKENSGLFHDCAICYSILNEDTRPRYKELSEYFFKNIDHKKYENILARPRPKSKYLNNRSELKFLELDKSIVIDNGKTNMAEVVAKSKIVVHFEHPSTNFLECIYVDHPVVAILTNEQPTEFVQPFYDFFLKNKVFHFDIYSLVAHMNNVNVNEWWGSIINEKMYREFKTSFTKKVKK